MPGTKKRMERCRVAYEASDFTLDSLSEKAGVARSTLNNYLKGITEDLKPHIVDRIADALGIGTDDLGEEQPIATVLTHCDRCRAAQDEHNRLLREDFNDRFAAMKEAYEDRIAHINDKLTQRLADQKERYEERHAMVLEHHAERVAKLNETITVLQADNVRMHKRNRVLLITLIILAIVVGILSVIDLSHEGIGWLPHILRLSTGAH